MTHELLRFGKQMAEDVSSYLEIHAYDEYSLRLTFDTKSNGEVSVLYYFNDAKRRLLFSMKGGQINPTSFPREQLVKTALEIEEALTAFKEIAEALEKKGLRRVTNCVLDYNERIRSLLARN